MLAKTEGDKSPAGFAEDEVRQLVERAERLNEAKNDINSDLRDLFKEAKGRGFNVKALQALIRIRQQDPDARRELQALTELYAQCCGTAI